MRRLRQELRSGERQRGGGHQGQSRKSNRALADELGVSEPTVRRARAASSDAADGPAGAGSDASLSLLNYNKLRSSNWSRCRKMARAEAAPGKARRRLAGHTFLREECYGSPFSNWKGTWSANCASFGSGDLGKMRMRFENKRAPHESAEQRAKTNTVAAEEVP